MVYAELRYLLETEKKYFEEIINLFLVDNGVRNATLIISFKQPNEYGDDFYDIKSISNIYFPNLCFIHEDRRILYYNRNITNREADEAMRKDIKMGEILGYFRPGKTSEDIMISYYINGNQIIGQSSDKEIEKEKLERKKNEIQSAINKIDDTYIVTYEVKHYLINSETLPDSILNNSMLIFENKYDIGNIYWNSSFYTTAEIIQNSSPQQFRELYQKHRIFWYTLSLFCKYQPESVFYPFSPKADKYYSKF